jgi:predicted transglutaminase-like cysteine proteinase
MIKKLIMSAVILTALIAAKESHAAGAGGFARVLAAAPAIHVQLAQTELQRMDQVDGVTQEKREQLTEVNADVNQAIATVDSYFGSFVGEVAASAGRNCFDCADIKLERLKSLGWSQDQMRIAYAINAEGRIERVVVVSDKDGDLVLGDDNAVIEFGSHRPVPVMEPKKAVSLAI